MRKSFGFHDRHSPFRFDPATLFIGGAVKGAFYDPSNITTLFQDDAGTTPVTAVEQTVGRVLDLSGNATHATQSVLASRPTYRARYNLFTYSEEFNQGVWSQNNISITANSVTAPNGTTTADTLTRTANPGSEARIRFTTTQANATTYTLSVYAKASTAGARLVLRNLAIDSGATNGVVQFNLASGTIDLTWGSVYASGNASIENTGGGWYRCVIRGTTLNPVVNNLVDIGVSNGSSALGGAINDAIYIWGAQLLSANDVTTTGNAYQRVAAATSYDTSSPVWRPYLAFDGSNDSMLTGSIDFTGTDKMTVCAGVTKSSDAAQGVVAELSATIASNNGTFLLSAPNSAAANYNWSSKGTTQVDNTVTTYTAPNTAVLTGQADIAAPSNIIRVNGAQAGSVATTQGTGNFGNYPLYIGRRNNATLPLNGRLYGLIVLGAAASSWQVYVTEQWMAGKTGLQF